MICSRRCRSSIFYCNTQRYQTSGGPAAAARRADEPPRARPAAHERRLQAPQRRYAAGIAARQRCPAPTAKRQRPRPRIRIRIHPLSARTDTARSPARRQRHQATVFPTTNLDWSDAEEQLSDTSHARPANDVGADAGSIQRGREGSHVIVAPGGHEWRQPIRLCHKLRFGFKLSLASRTITHIAAESPERNHLGISNLQLYHHTFRKDDICRF